MKTKRPKLPMPRRRLALLWLLVPCLLLLAAYITDVYRFTPDQAQRLEEKRRLLEPMEVLWQGDVPWEQEVPAIGRFAANARAVGFSEDDFLWRAGGGRGRSRTAGRRAGKGNGGGIWSARSRRRANPRRSPMGSAACWGWTLRRGTLRP